MRTRARITIILPGRRSGNQGHNGRRFLRAAVGILEDGLDRWPRRPHRANVALGVLDQDAGTVSTAVRAWPARA